MSAPLCFKISVEEVNPLTGYTNWVHMGKPTHILLQHYSSNTWKEGGEISTNPNMPLCSRPSKGVAARVLGLANHDRRSICCPIRASESIPSLMSCLSKIWYTGCCCTLVQFHLHIMVTADIPLLSLSYRLYPECSRVGRDEFDISIQITITHSATCMQLSQFRCIRALKEANSALTVLVNLMLCASLCCPVVNCHIEGWRMKEIGRMEQKINECFQPRRVWCWHSTRRPL